MILRLLNREDDAKKYLEPINSGMDIIENVAYHQLCLFYKEQISSEELEKNLTKFPSSDGTKYGIANRHFYNGQKKS